jgi:hypothetical protein
VSNTRSILEKIFCDENDKPVVGVRPEDAKDPYIPLKENETEKELIKRVAPLHQSEMKQM